VALGSFALSLARGGSVSGGSLGQSYSDSHLNCPKGILPATIRGDNPEVWNAVSLEMARRVDKIYWLCVHEGCDVPFPDEIFDKVVVFRGEEVDVCNAFVIDGKPREGLGGHTLQASAMHMLATMHGWSQNANAVMIMEQDTVIDGGVEWSADDWSSFDAALEAKPWNVIRMGYRPIQYEYSGDHACEPQCMCEVATSKACFLAGAGCDLRGADAYVVHNRFFSRYVDMFQGPGCIDQVTCSAVDNGVLNQQVDNSFVLMPQWNYQTEAKADGISFDAQRANAGLLSKNCFNPTTPEW
jgi:hypothetical protein